MMTAVLPELSREMIEAIVICTTVIATAVLLGWLMVNINDRRKDAEFEIGNEELTEMLTRRNEHE